ncbi:hypothetical protein RIF29_03853 [Crotalaria pallida]|uniref:PB1-like domain-containing protein n=1 Tax=Crotalaria pallida TaxID=3830 RepID=A0AAN9J0D5_CROPI
MISGLMCYVICCSCCRCGMDNYFRVHVHHGGHFVSGDRSKYLGYVSLWNCDPDRWSYFELLDIAKEMHYPEIDSMWYKGWKNELKHLSDDKGALQLAKIAAAKGAAHFYLLHTVSQPDIVRSLPCGNYNAQFMGKNDGPGDGGREDIGPKNVGHGTAQTNIVLDEATENVGLENVGPENTGQETAETNTKNAGQEQEDGEAKEDGTAQTNIVVDEATENEQEDGEAEEDGTNYDNDDSALKVRFDDSDDDHIEEDLFGCERKIANANTDATNPEAINVDANTEPVAAENAAETVATNPEATNAAEPVAAENVIDANTQTESQNRSKKKEAGHQRNKLLIQLRV